MSGAEFLDGLDAARAKGTADGKWRVLDIDNRPGQHSREILDDEGSVAVCSGDNDATGNTLGADRAALIVAAVNALPKLTAALRAVEGLAERFGWDTMREPDWTGQQVATAIRDTLADALADES